MEYSIGEFSRLTSLSVHTLRYYEHEGLIVPHRNSSDRRRYSEGDVAWIDFIKRLKDTGMPIKDIQRYAALRAAGEETLRQRLELLSSHREVLSQQIECLRGHMEKLDEKIDFYRNEIKRTSRK